MSEQNSLPPQFHPEDLHIRSFTAADRPQVGQLYATLEADCIDCGCTTSVDQIEENYFRRPQDHFWVAEIQGRIMGTAAIRVTDQEVAHLNCLRVFGDSTDHLIRKALVQAAAGHARRHGSLKLVIHANVEVGRATPFLHRLGFEFSRHREIEKQPALEFYLNLYELPELEARQRAARSITGGEGK